jgi:hypothetical protein
MTKNDKTLMKQMIEAGRFNYGIYELLVEINAKNSKDMVKKMGDKWCCHPSNQVKRLDVPLPLLTDIRQSKVLRRK